MSTVQWSSSLTSTVGIRINVRTGKVPTAAESRTQSQEDENRDLWTAYANIPRTSSMAILRRREALLFSLAGILDSLTAVPSASAQTPTIRLVLGREPGGRTVPSASAQTPTIRAALVVGLGDYSDAPLPNPPKDAVLVTATLEQHNGFQVTTLTDANGAVTKAQIERKIGELCELGKSGRESGQDTSLLVYFAGHGGQCENEDYFVPTSGAKLLDGFSHPKDEVESLALRVQSIVDQLSSSGATRAFVILDACRRSLTVGPTRAIDHGFQPLAIPAPTMVIASTSPTFLALDNLTPDTGHSPFATAFAESLTIPGLAATDVYERVRSRVWTSTSQRQLPYLQGHANFEFRAIRAGEVRGQVGSLVPLRDQSQLSVAYFPFDHTNLTPEAQVVVYQAATETAKLAVNGKAKSVILVGYADGGPVGDSVEGQSRIYRLRVAERRAIAVADALVALGIDPQIISIEGKLSPENIRDPLWRRVEITVVIPV